MNEAIANGGYLYKDPEDGEEDVFFDFEERDKVEYVDENGDIRVDTKCGKKGKKGKGKKWGK